MRSILHLHHSCCHWFVQYVVEKKILYFAFCSIFHIHIGQCTLDGLKWKGIAKWFPFEDTVQSDSFCIPIIDVQNLRTEEIEKKNAQFLRAENRWNDITNKLWRSMNFVTRARYISPSTSYRAKTVSPTPEMHVFFSHRMNSDRKLIEYLVYLVIWSHSGSQRFGSNFAEIQQIDWQKIPAAHKSRHNQRQHW